MDGACGTSSFGTEAGISYASGWTVPQMEQDCHRSRSRARPCNDRGWRVSTAARPGGSCGSRFPRRTTVAARRPVGRSRSQQSGSGAPYRANQDPAVLWTLRPNGPISREPKGSRRQIIFFIGLFQHLEDLKLLYKWVDFLEEPADDLTLVPSFVPPCEDGWR